MNRSGNVHAVVIGAGFGGLAAAAHLAHAGVNVTVLEKAETVGGKAAHVACDGFEFDAGPTLLTMPWIASETFAAAGAELEKVAPLTRLDPSCRYVLADGKDLLICADPGRTRASIERVSAEDAKHWEAFLSVCKEIWEATGEPYVEAPFDGIFGFSRRLLRRGLKPLKVSAGLGTLEELARRHFQSPVMRAFVCRFASYAGGSPFHASGALAMIPYIEISLGTFYPRGGMHALALALARAVRARGVRVIPRAEVISVDVSEGGNVTGVRSRMPDGSVLRMDADAVIANVDPLVVVSRLLPESRRRTAGMTKLANRTPSLSGFGWAFGIEGPAPTSVVHTVFLGRDYEDEFRSLFERGAITDEPTVHLSVPTLIDPARAPEGHHSVFALMNAPATACSIDWEKEAPRLRTMILSRIEGECGSRLARRIRAERFVTPQDIALTGSPDGAIYGAAPHGAFAAFDRPANRVPGVTGLYLAGGATRPGGGVTLVMRSGRFAAELLVRDVRAKRVAPRTSRHGVSHVTKSERGLPF